MKRSFLIIILAVLVTALYGLSEATEGELQYYNMAGSIREKIGIVQGLADAKTDDAGEFYAVALDQLLREYPAVRGNQELQAADTLARLLAGLLGDEKYQDAAQNLWRTVNTFSNAMVKEAALISLGKIGAKELLPQVVQLLSDLNTHPRSDQAAKESGERTAYGAIIALENYKDPSGYLPVFFASIGWYHDRVKNRAQAALPEIIEDPSEPLTAIIQGTGYSYNEKYVALQTIERSWVSGDKKAAVALAALTEGWRSSTSDPRLRRDLVEMRKLAINMIGRYGIQDAAVYPLLERSYKEGSEDEKIPAVTTLAALATEDAAQLLVGFLKDLTVKLDRGSLTREDERLVREVIPALGRTRQPSAAAILRSVRGMNWTGYVKRLAEDALKQIG